MEDMISFEQGKTPFEQPHSNLALSNSLRYVQLTELNDGEGSLLYFPAKKGVGTSLEVGDILFLREKDSKILSSEEIGGKYEENGVVVQILTLGTANYPHSQTKALFRVMVNVRATNFQRNHNEPPETIDELLEAKFMVRASIVDGKWKAPEGRVVTRNVDIFQLNPKILSEEIFFKSNLACLDKEIFQVISSESVSIGEVLKQNSSEKKVSSIDSLYIIDPNKISDQKAKDVLKKSLLDVHLGFYKDEPVEFFGGGFEKINLITGMKGGGKSHLAKGIIGESLKGGMSAIVFDINNEYDHFPNSHAYVPSENLKFRLDRIDPPVFLSLINRLAPFAEKTKYIAESRLPNLIREHTQLGKHPDIAFLMSQSNNVIKGTGQANDSMRGSYTTSLQVLDNYNLIMSQQEAMLEDQFLRHEREKPKVVSLSSALYELENSSKSGVMIFSLAGKSRILQYSIVDMILETLKKICKKQAKYVEDGKRDIPSFPTIYFEEAHMYMEDRVIDELLPVIRHFGMNVFFITNTPEALPESVFRLLDNMIMTRIVNKKDIDKVKNCGLTDTNTIECFATNLREHHALLLSGLTGSTKNFPLVFKVRDFGLKKSGETKSRWTSLLTSNSK